MFVFDRDPRGSVVALLVEMVVERKGCGNASRPESFDQLAASDLHQPRPELAFVVERLQPAKGHQQSRLDDILGLVKVARFRESDRQQAPFIALGQLAECFYVAKPYAGHKLRIGYQSRSLPLSASEPPQQHRRLPAAFCGTKCLRTSEYHRL